MSCDNLESGQFIETRVQSYKLGYNVVGSVLGSDDTSFPALAPQIAEPNSDDIPGLVAIGDNFADLVFMLSLAEGETTASGTARISRWEKVRSPNAASALWVPIPMVDVDLASGLQTGVDGSVVPAGFLFCSTISLATNAAYDPAYEVQTNVPTGLIGSFRVDHKGAKYLHVGFNVSGTPGAGYGNFLVKTY